MFDEPAKELLGCDANELHQLKEHDTSAYEAVYQQALLTEHLFWITAKREMVIDEERIRRTVRKVSPINYITESKNLLKLIKEYD